MQSSFLDVVCGTDILQQQSDIHNCASEDVVEENALNHAVISLSATFSSFQELHETVQQYARSQIFGLSRNFRNFTKEEFIKEYGDTEFIKIQRRGYYYCNSCGFPQSGGEQNRFRIQVVFDPSVHKYRFDPSLCCLEHNHILKKDERRASNRVLISYQNQMSPAELQYLLNLGRLQLISRRLGKL